MDDGLKWFRLLDDYSEIKSYCVVAGGDGTVGKFIKIQHATHYHLEIQANPQKMAQKDDAILASMGETGLSHDIFF